MKQYRLRIGRQEGRRSLKKKYSQRKRVQMCPTLRLRGDQTGMGKIRAGGLIQVWWGERGVAKMRGKDDKFVY